MRKSIFICCYFLISWNAHATITPGAIALLKECPGVDRPKYLDSNESLGSAILSPILSFAINQGLKTAGAKLQEIAKEATVDVLHHGNHFYEWKNNTWNFQHGCLVIASKETKRTKENISVAYSEYESVDELISTVKNLVFATDSKQFSKPGLTAIFEFELSQQATEFRLKPRWVRLNHSIREKRTDKRARDITLEFSFAVPGSDKPITSLIKFEGIKIGQSIRTDGLATQWMPVPTLNSSELTKQQSLSQSLSKKATYANAASLAGAAANALGADIWIPPRETTEWDPILPDGVCPSKEESFEEWRYAHGLHNVESAKSKEDINAQTLSMLSNTVSYFENCSKAQESAAKVVKLTPSEGKLARSYDFSVTIKEFRKRPVAQFFGDALSDENTRSSLSSTILGELDPYTKAKAKEEEVKIQLAALGVYEQARYDAELAIIEYQNASAADKASKLLNMDFKKRAANRAADTVGVTQPYPDKGTWFQ